jgi:hypothetical protein
LALLLLSLSGCVELVRQRICVSYDSKTDTLNLLLFYDGIHEAKKGDASGAKDIPDFVAKNKVMFLDWYGEINPTDADKPSAPTDPWSRLRQLVAGSMKTLPVGHYRDARGHVGAAQLVVLSHAGDLIKQLNDALNHAEPSFKVDSIDGAGMGRTAALWRDAAAHGHQWFTLEGQSLQFTFPVHPGEWRVAKAKGLWNLFKGLQLESMSGKARADLIESMRNIVSFLATSAVSYEESDGRVTVRLGNRESPNVYRVPLHREYEPSLEPVVEKSVPRDLQDDLARFILGRTDRPAPGIAEVIAFGPAESVPAALARAATGKDESLHDAAIAKLGEWARQWNQSRVVPAAPEVFDALKWKDWLANFGRIPDEILDEPIPTTRPAE